MSQPAIPGQLLSKLYWPPMGRMWAARRTAESSLGQATQQHPLDWKLAREVNPKQNRNGHETRARGEPTRARYTAPSLDVVPSLKDEAPRTHPSTTLSYVQQVRPSSNAGGGSKPRTCSGETKINADTRLNPPRTPLKSDELT